MRLSIDIRSRVVAIYFNKSLHFMKKKYEKLMNIAAEQNIYATSRTMRKIIQRFIIKYICI